MLNRTHRAIGLGGVKIALALTMGTALAMPASAALVNHYTFDTDASDSAGTRDGTLTGAVIDTGDAIRGTGSLDTNSGYVDLPSTSSLGVSQYTLAMWVKIDSATTDSISALFTTDNPGGNGLHVNHLNGDISYSVGFPTTAVSVPPPPTDWIHVAITHQTVGAGTAMYINGNLESSSTQGGPTTIFDNAQVGAWTGTRPLSGSIDDLRIYDEVLTAGQIQALVPEPASLALLGVGGLLMLRRRHAS